MARCELHFVGSVPMKNAREVIGALGMRFAPFLRRVPDGETGERINWVQYQEDVFRTHPAMEAVQPPEPDWRNRGAQRRQTVQFRPRRDAWSLAFGELGYARHALHSYAEFAELKRAARVPAHCRFQVALPSPYNVVNWCVVPEARAAVEAAYEARLLDEVGLIAAGVPHHELAIQWDCAHDMQAYDGARQAWFEPAREGIVERLARIGDAVPRKIELGYHLCYGSFGGRHFVEPKDARAMVDLTNALLACIRRDVQWVHMPVPIERQDDDYYAPLASLRFGRGTTLYLGLLHDQDGAEGTLRRVRVAERYVKDFGIATECGFGRRPPDTLERLLQVHEAVMREVCGARI
jgi:hypothetical protein